MSVLLWHATLRNILSTAAQYDRPSSDTLSLTAPPMKLTVLPLYKLVTNWNFAQKLVKRSWVEASQAPQKIGDT